MSIENEITGIDARVGKRGKREVMEFSGVRAQREIDSYKKEMEMTSQNLKDYRDSASSSALLAKSYASGGSSVRDGEETDNAKYYAQQAKAEKMGAAGYAGSASSSMTAAKAAQDATEEAKEGATTAKTSAESAATAALTSSSSASSSAKTAQSWAAGGTNTRTGEDTDNAKYYAEQAKKSAGAVAGVSSFNGRSGEVVPQSGDYSYDMITGTPPVTTYDTATSSSDGLMSKEDKAKLDGIAAGATKTTIDSALSSTSTNPVQNKAVNTAITNLKAVATTSANGLMSASDKTKLNGIATGAQVNQNAFSTIAVGSASVTADSTTDTLTLAGSNVTLTPDTSNDKITIGITKTNVTDALGYTPPESDTTYEAATTSVAGLMSSSDKSKLDGIAEGANKTVVDSQWSSTSTNPIQNKILNAAIAGLKAVATTSANGLMSAADKTKLDSIEESATKVKRLATKSLTASGGTLTWTDSEIGNTSLIDVYATIPNIAPSEISQSGTTVTVTFDSQDSAFNVCITVQN